MLKLLVPVDGSDNSQRAVEHVIAMCAELKALPEVHLLTVQLPLAGVHVKLFIKKEDLNDYYREESLVALKRARERLDGAGVRYVHHIGVGDPGEVIAQYAESKDCDQLIMGRRGLSPMADLLLGSVTHKVIGLVRVPMVLIR